MSRARKVALALLAAWLCLAGPTRAETPAERLAGALRFPTVSRGNGAPPAGKALEGLRRYLQAKFPRVRAKLTREVIGGGSLLYEWKGSDASLAPMLIAAHMDVVPVASPQAWTHPPFAGDIDDGYVWGRGSLDDKVGVLGALEAVEDLLGRGFAPRRTLYLAFGDDEEVGGRGGAALITRTLEARGIHLWMTLDEGDAIGQGLFPGIAAPVAMIGIAEKGYLTLRLAAHAAGGHSSVPEPGAAIPRIAAAVARLDANPLPARLNVVVASMLEALAPHMSLLPRIVMDHPNLFAPLLVARLSASPGSAAMVHTTTALTMIGGGVKENVLPRSAWAVVNLRIAPGDTVSSVTDDVRRIVGDPDVAIEVLDANEPSKVADVHSDSYRVVAASVKETVPDVVVAPALVIAGTDTKHYGRIAENSYRFSPFRLGPGDVSRIHGVDERLSISNYSEVVRFYEALLRRGLAADGPRP